MIIELLVIPFFKIIELLIALFPQGATLPNYITQTVILISKGLAIFPLDLWVVVIANISFWLSVQYTWAIIEWIYKKIPGVN